ncbi:MAG: FAD-binding oxidoreductase, partial [Candidatus Nanopelagicales bacterium]
MPDDMRSLARWGADGDAPVLSAQVRDFLSSRVGQAVPWQAADPESWQVAPSRVAADVVADLASAVGAQHVSDSRADRLRATGGAAFIDYARRRAGIVDDAPDVVVSPGSHDEVLAVLACARCHRLAVLPVGGG